MPSAGTKNKKPRPEEHFLVSRAPDGRFTIVLGRDLAYTLWLEMDSSEFTGLNDIADKINLIMEYEEGQSFVGPDHEDDD